MAPKFERVHCSITERSDDWEARYQDGTVEVYGTAAEAQRGVRARGTKLAEAGVSTITMIDWSPTTAVGRSVVKALQ